MASDAVQPPADPGSDVITLSKYIAGRWVPPDTRAYSDVINQPPSRSCPLPQLLPRRRRRRRRRGQSRLLWLAEHAPPPAGHPNVALRQKIVDASDELAEAITKEHGKGLRKSRDELLRTLLCVEDACAVTQTMKGSFTEDIAHGVDEYTIREPLGGFLVLPPFNFPAMVSTYFVWAVACGSTVVIKPSGPCPVTTHLIVKLAEECGFPAGVINILNGAGAAICDHLVAHPDVACVSFVGSSKVGLHIYATACAKGKRAQVQGGAKNHVLVMEDALMDHSVKNVGEFVVRARGRALLRRLELDTNVFLGEEGPRIRRVGRVVGGVETEEYGSKMLALDSVNTLHGASGSTAARTMADPCSYRRVEIKIEGGARLSVEVGKPPVVDGTEPDLMRVGCGSATTAMFAPYRRAVANETIVLDPDITGLLSEHAAGRALGMTWSGVTPAGSKTTAGRYFGAAGSGIEGTCIANPNDAVGSLDPAARPGVTLFVTDTAGEAGYLFRLTDDCSWDPLDLTPEAVKAMAVIREKTQPTRVSALLVRGEVGSARSGVTKFPVKLNRAVHDGRLRLTVGGADVFLYPCGGITFAVDVERLPRGAITWVPTPALIAPIEYAMTRDIYAAVEGHLEAVRRRADVLAERTHITIGDPSEA